MMLHELDFKEAAQILCDHVAPVSTETLPLTESLDRILAASVKAQSDVPPFDRSPFDGYAFRAEDTESASPEHPVTLRVLEEIPAGSVGTRRIVRGTAAKILTGAPIPLGADTVCKFEDTTFTPETVTLRRKCLSGKNICLRGEDLSAGDILASRGTRIDAALMGTLATQNVAFPLCFRRPKAGIITTGSELCAVGQPLTGGKIINSNYYTFHGALQKAGCIPTFYGAPADDVDAIVQCLREASEESDLIITTGGVSVGDYDLTPAALTAAGGEILLQNVNLKPGGKCCFGTLGERLVCCLSGNPASSLTTFYAVVLPALYKLSGHADYLPKEIQLTLLEDFPKKSPKPRLLRGTLEQTDGTTGMHITGEQGNGILHTMIGCNALALVPAGSGPLKAGTTLWGYFLTHRNGGTP